MDPIVNVLNDTQFEQLKSRVCSNGGFIVKDRRYLFKTFKSCFVGYEAVDWLYSNVAGMTSREEAVQLGQRLLESGLFTLVSNPTDLIFKDDYLFYQFRLKPTTTVTPSQPTTSTTAAMSGIKSGTAPQGVSSLRTSNSSNSRTVSNSQYSFVNQIKSASPKSLDETTFKEDLLQLSIDLMNNEKGLKLTKKKKNILGPSLHCFFGGQLIDWLVKKLNIARREAIWIANGLLGLNIFIEVGSKDLSNSSGGINILKSSSGAVPMSPSLSTSESTTPNFSPLSTSTSSFPPPPSMSGSSNNSSGSGKTAKTQLFDEDSHYEFLTKPESIINHVSMKKLDELCLSHKSLVQIPTTIINTSKYLKILDLSFNSISDFNQLESVSTLYGLENCNLSHNSLNNLPSSFNRLEQIVKLNISHNNFVQIPIVVFQIASLREFFISSNQLVSISESIGRLTQLEHLDLKNNKIQKIPKEIGLLANLRGLDISGYNKITELPAFLSSISSLTSLEFNPETIKFPAKSVTSKGFQHIIGYLKDLYEGTITLPSTKLFVVGPERTGKTNLIKALTKSSQQKTLSKNVLKKVSTPDIFTNDPIEITEWAIDVPEAKSSLSGSTGSTGGMSSSVSFTSLASLVPPTSSNINNTLPASPKEKKRSGSLSNKRSLKVLTYDFKFSAPEVYYNTVQFFLSERAFYLITIDINKDPVQSNLDFWVNSIRAKAPTAPIYVVATMIDQYVSNPPGDIMKPLSEIELYLNQKMLEVTGVIGVSSSSLRNIELLKSEIQNTLLQQSWIHEKIPSIYVTLEANLQDEAKKRQPPIVTWEEYQNIAKMSNFTSSEKLIRATHTLNRWGSIMWLDESKAGLKDLVILKPQWLSDCFSQLVAARHTLVSKDAILQISSLRSIWKPSLIPESFHIKILKILEKYQLLYALKNSKESSSSASEQQLSSSPSQYYDFHKSLPVNSNPSNQSAPLPYHPHNSFNGLREESSSSSLSLSSSNAFVNPATLSSFVHPSLIEHFSANPMLNASPKMLRNSLKTLKPLSASTDSAFTSPLNLKDLPFDRVIIPCLLPTVKPLQLESLWDTWSGEDQHQIGRYFQFINSPKVCFERLLLRFLFMMDPILYWSNGILFRKPQHGQETIKNSMTNCGTLVEYEGVTNQLSIKVRGPDFDTCAKLFQIILENIDTILKDYQFQLHTTLIPCSCSVQCRNSPHLYPIDFIEGNFDKGDINVRCPSTQNQVSLNRLAPDITLSTVSSNKKIAKEDLGLLEEIGFGGFSKVYRGLYKGNQVVAIKQLNFERMDLAVEPIFQFGSANSTNNSFGHSSSLSSSGSIGRTLSSSVLQPMKVLNRNSSVSSISSTSSSEDSSITQARITAINEFRREVWLMSSLSHPNIIAMKGFSFDPYAIVMEYMDLGNLSTYLLAKKQEGTTLSWSVILKIARDIAEGMSFLHNSTPPLVHRDLKSPNILLSTYPEEPFIIAKVSDFGLSRSVVQGFVSKVVDNPTWLAPEVLKAYEYNEKGDVYSFGIILWELYHMEIPFDEFDLKFMSTLEDHIIAGVRPTISQNCNRLYSSLITKCWNSDPLLRPSFDSIIKTIEEINVSIMKS